MVVVTVNGHKLEWINDFMIDIVKTYFFLIVTVGWQILINRRSVCAIVINVLQNKIKINRYFNVISIYFPRKMAH